MALSDMYQEIILDHYRRPRNRGKLENPVHHCELANPTCGDVIVLHLGVDAKSQKVVDVKFSGHGCSISQASASMMTQAIKGKKVADALKLADKFKAMMRGEPGNYKDLGELLSLQGVSKYPVRIKCATLAWNALQLAIDPAAEKEEGLE
jgi:nitrogen fixation NifU-like protein